MFNVKQLGKILLILGIIGLIYFGYQAIQDSDSFRVLGIDVAVSKANWTPVIISGVITLLGLLLSLRK